MRTLREIARWGRRCFRAVRNFERRLDVPSWRSSESPHGPGIALTLQGHDLWLSSPDATLEPTPEAAICLLAPWCAQESVALRISQAHLSPVFLANVQSATAVMGRWWKHQAIHFLTPAPLDLPAPSASTNQGAKALFFSGGVDSFYSLIMNTDVKVIVFVVGFDIRLANRAAWEVMLLSNRKVASARGIRLITVFTNLREHPIPREVKWERYHGAALAAVAHSLRSQASNWIISASWFPGFDMPWGSHLELDWRWGNEAVNLVHFGVDKRRGEKLAAMAHEPLVHDFLHVCWRDPIPAGNCGKCEKCIRTRLTYHCEIPQYRCKRMPDFPPLPEGVDGIDVLRYLYLEKAYERFLTSLPPADPIAAAIERLLTRTRPET